LINNKKKASPLVGSFFLSCYFHTEDKPTIGRCLGQNKLFIRKAPEGIGKEKKERGKETTQARKKEGFHRRKRGSFTF